MYRLLFAKGTGAASRLSESGQSHYFWARLAPTEMEAYTKANSSSEKVLDREIAQFMIVASKFEFFLVNFDQRFAHIDGETQVVKGVNWDQLGRALEERFPFEDYDFENSDFHIFKDTVPQKLVARQAGGLTWDSDEVNVSSWQVLLGRSYAQLRNNVAHGNKGQLPAPFTHERTEEFLAAGLALINFIARDFFGDENWKSPIQFQ